MSTSHYFKAIGATSAAAAILAGCSASAGKLGPAQTLPTVAEPSAARDTKAVPVDLELAIRPALHEQPDTRRSWMRPDAKHRPLMYISDEGTYEVYVFSYPDGAPVGALTGLVAPAGLCTDKNGDVFVANEGALNVVEYAHGGTTPIATLSTLNGLPLGCAVDPTTGNLAVSNFYDFDRTGGVLIYQHAAGAPVQYSDPNLYYYWAPAYDDRGNLFVEGRSQENISGLAELPAHDNAFVDISTSKYIYFPGGAGWDGRHVDASDQEYQGVETTGIYQLRITGKRAKVVGATKLAGSCNLSDVLQYEIVGFRGKKHPANRVIGPNAVCATTEYWSYPSGGIATTVLTGFNLPIGVTISYGK